MKLKERLYCDMDGVLADFDAVENAKERFENEINFFFNLKPLTNNVKTLNKLIKQNKDLVYILSISPNLRSDRDKIRWLNKYLPHLKKENIIIIRKGQKKHNFGSGILLDDYNVNRRLRVENNKNNQAYPINKDGDIKIALKNIEWDN